MATFSLRARDMSDGSDDDYVYDPPNGLLFGFFILFLFACGVSFSLFYLRRRRFLRQMALLPTHQRRGHQRSLTITSTPAYTGQERVYVYDDKMNMIGSSNCAPDSPVPEIRITFPDEVDQASGQKTSGRVVVVRITDSGNVGMEPLHSEELPPYQKADNGRFQSLDLDRLGGLREAQEQQTASQSQPRWG